MTGVAAILPFTTDKGVASSEMEVARGQCEAVGGANFFEDGRQWKDASGMSGLVVHLEG